MKLKKYSKNISFVSVTILGLALCTALYSSSANNAELEGESGSDEVMIEDEELVDDGNEGEIEEVEQEDIENELHEGIDENSGGLVEIVEDEDDEEAKEGEEDIQENVDDETQKKGDKKELVIRNSNLPKLVGIDATKDGIDEGMPLLPGFKEEDGKYICEVNNIYETKIIMYKYKEDNKDLVIIQLGGEVIEDEQVQGIVKLILDYYSGHKWRFVPSGVSSYFEIEL